MPLSTVFRPENVTSDLAGIHELSDFSGLPLEDLSEFRPERLAVHELLIRVTVDLAVPDGTEYQDLGTNFRGIAGTILSKYIDPRMDEVRQLHAGLRHQVCRFVDRELEACFRPPSRSAPAPARRGPLARLGFAGKRGPAQACTESPEERDQRVVMEWSEKAAASGTEVERRSTKRLGAWLPL